jgi:hypothetical protein
LSRGIVCRPNGHPNSGQVLRRKLALFDRESELAADPLHRFRDSGAHHPQLRSCLEKSGCPSGGNRSAAYQQNRSALQLEVNGIESHMKSSF